jgi:hypothetical protein
MGEFPVWPDTTQHKSARQIIRKQSDVAIAKYQEVVERQIFKAAEEKRKQV